VKRRHTVLFGRITKADIKKGTMKNNLFKFPLLATITILMYDGCSDSTVGNSQYSFENISIERIKSSEEDRQRIRQLHLNTSDSSIYIIKIQAKLPPPANSGFHIYFGDIEIEEFGPYNSGIYFKVYSEETLNTLLGKNLSYSIGLDEKRYLTEITAPNSNQIKNKDSVYESLPDFVKCFQVESEGLH
jgi:hypothetical protein